MGKNNKKFTIDEINKYFNEKGFTLLENYIENILREININT